MTPAARNATATVNLVIHAIVCLFSLSWLALTILWAERMMMMKAEDLVSEP